MLPEAKIAIVMGGVLLGGEVAVRWLEPTLSKDLAHVRTFSDLGEKLAPPETGNDRILILGNSLARHGLDLETFAAVWPGERKAELFRMMPDATVIDEWTWGFRRYISQRQGKPDWVLLFTGPLHLSDQPPRNPERMGAFFVSSEDRLAYLLDHLPDTESRSRFLIASASRFFANRKRVRPLLFYNLVPGYEAASRAINSGVKESAEELEPSRPSLAQLEILLESATGCGSRVVIVSVPVPGGPYALPEGVGELAERHGIQVIELGAELIVPDDGFPDGYHLGPEAARAFTEELLRRLSVPQDS